jgi:arylsulfatase A
MKRLLTLILLLVPLAVCDAETVAAKRPNVLLICTDDQGYGDFGAQNPDSKIPTPNLDRLAAEGIRFTDAHSSSGICTPSRYALLTGRYHWRQGHGIVGSHGQPWFDKNRWTLADMLKENGYRTACIGKWHLGWDWNVIRNPGKEQLAPDGHDWSKPLPGGPLERGFDYYFGDDVPNFPPYTWIENDRILIEPTVPFTPIPVPQPGDEGGERMSGHDSRDGAMVEGWRLDSVPPRIAERTVEWIAEQKNSERPFFLYWAWTGPHTPVVPLPEFQGKTNAGPYGDYMHQLDFHLGQTLDALEQHGFKDNTLVIFTSDNGPEDIAYARIQNHGHRSSGPLRGVKRDIWEGGHRVPFVVRWPRAIKGGQVNDQLISQIDIMATLAAITGSDLPKGAAEDSYNLLPVWTEGAPSPRTTLIHNTPRNRYAIRHDDWLMIDNTSGGVSRVPDWFNEKFFYPDNSHPGELYNLADDLAQRNNLWAEHPELIEELRQKLNGIRRSGQVR